MKDKELIKLKTEVKLLSERLNDFEMHKINRIKAGHFIIESTEENINQLIKKMPKLIDSVKGKKLNDLDLDDENYIG